ncbi:MAG TPA: class I SAM-dependent methyltransferase [Ktedonobacteraceae bacterium]|nr:class I SAM-dependent methyltransferase [Ktedonobacteraceae bacterium]
MQAQEIYRPFYTKSSSLVKYMMKMLSVQPGMRVLEPCAGDGVFIDAIMSTVLDTILDVYELNPDAVSLLREKYRWCKNIVVNYADALTSDELTFYVNSGGIYDRIIANPPYGGWQDYEKRKDLKKQYVNIYVKETYALFLYRCIKLLKNGGRLVFIIPDTFLNLHMFTSLRDYILVNTKIKEISLFPSSFFPNVNFGYSNLSIITLEKQEDRDTCLENQFSVLTGFRNVEELEAPHEYSNVYNFTQREVYNHLEHALFVANNPVKTLLRSSKLRIGNMADCVTGIYSGDDKRHLRPLSLEVKNGKKYLPVDKHLVCVDYDTKDNILDGLDSLQCFVPIVKGGAIKYWKPDLWYIDWSRDAVRTYKTDKKARFQNSKFYFKYGVGVPMVSSSQVTATLIENKLFDQSIVGIFPHDPQWTYYLLAFFNSSTCTKLLRTINPSANNSANYIKKIPLVLPDAHLKEILDTKVKHVLALLRSGDKYEEKLILDIDGIIADLYGL